MEIDLLAVNRKIIGPVAPVGETQSDDVRYENLMVLCELVGNLVSMIDGVAFYRNDHLASRKRAGEYADKFLDKLGIEK